MSIETKLVGKVRGLFLDLLPPWRNEQIHLSGQGEQMMVQAATPYQEIVRQGRAFMVNTTAAIASVIAVPTTAHGLALYNNEPDGGRSYIIGRIWALYTVNSGAALAQVGIIGNLGQVREAAPTDAGLAIKQLNGLGNKDTRARTILGATALPATTGLAANWFPLGASVNSTVNSLPGFQQVAEVNGRLIVPPGRYFALHTLGSVTSSSAILGIEWHEKQLLLG